MLHSATDSAPLPRQRLPPSVLPGDQLAYFYFAQSLVSLRQPLKFFNAVPNFADLSLEPLCGGPDLCGFGHIRLSPRVLVEVILDKSK